jgi:prevent-host-death family protein
VANAAISGVIAALFSGVAEVDEVATSSYTAPMQTVGIKELKNKLSAYLRAVAAGETVVVTDRGQVVAELVGVRARSGATAAEQMLRHLQRQGLLTPAKAPPKSPLPRRNPIARLSDIVADLDESRADR